VPAIRSTFNWPAALHSFKNIYSVRGALMASITVDIFQAQKMFGGATSVCSASHLPAFLFIPCADS
jgi:hypothetical protein